MFKSGEAAARATEAAFVLPFLIMGLSHIIQPAMWRAYFKHLHGMGAIGVIYRTFMLELWPAMIIVAFHQVWSGWGVLLTIYGWALMVKIALALLAPNIGLRSLAMAERYGDQGFRAGGVVLIGLGLLCFSLILM